MRHAIQFLVLTFVFTACKKDKVEIDIPVVPAVSKWVQISGDYKVYDTVGAFLYNMQISHSKGQTEQGYKTDSLRFSNFDGNFNFTAVQGGGCTVNCLWVGSHTAVHDSIDNRWNIFGYNYDEIYNNFHNDTIIMYFQKHNMPYWWNDEAIYSNTNQKHVAVKQH